MGVKCVVIKLSNKGNYIRTDRLEYYIPAFKANQCIGSTSAGDSYVAGFIWGLKNGLKLKEC